MSLVAVERADAARLDELRDLFLALHHEHRVPADLPLTEPDERAWAERRATYAGHFAAGRALLFLAENEGRVIGYALAVVREGSNDTFPLGRRYGELYSLFVALEWRNNGVGARLVDAVEAGLAAQGIENLVVAVMAHNVAAQRFYRRRGLVAGEVLLYRIADPYASRIARARD